MRSSKLNYFSGVASNDFAHGTFRRKLDRSGYEKSIWRGFGCGAQRTGEQTDKIKNAHFLWSVWKDAYDLNQKITFSREPASVPLKELLVTILDHFNPAL